MCKDGVRPAKAGHAGTLDPLATGVLVVCVGPATRLVSYVQQMPKTYEATFLLGLTSPSDDTETELTRVSQAREPTLPEIEAQLPQFLGSVQQRPPAYSALKVQGQRAYKLAREGKTVELAERPVEIYELRITGYCYPELKLTIRCGSGTYVRSIGRDLAESLGTGAVMSALTRVAIGKFTVDQAMHVDQLDQAAIEANLIPALAAVSHLPQLLLNDAQEIELQHGRRIAASDFGLSPPPPGAVYAAVGATGQLLALLGERKPGLLGPLNNFSQPA